MQIRHIGARAVAYAPLDIESLCETVEVVLHGREYVGERAVGFVADALDHPQQLAGLGLHGFRAPFLDQIEQRIQGSDGRVEGGGELAHAEAAREIAKFIGQIFLRAIDFERRERPAHIRAREEIVELSDTRFKASAPPSHQDCWRRDVQRTTL